MAVARQPPSKSSGEPHEVREPHEAWLKFQRCEFLIVFSGQKMADGDSQILLALDYLERSRCNVLEKMFRRKLSNQF